MSGTDGANGIGWMVDFDGKERLTITVDRIEDGVTLKDALAAMKIARDAYLAAENAYYAEQGAASLERSPAERRARRCAVYRFFDAGGALLYVGKAIDPVARQKQHEHRVWWPDVARVAVDWFDNERLALDAEDVAIRDENPLYNRVGGGR
ncbi:MAG: hypothetical protein JSS74_09065 [Actinobacteria bacterium]|nr:hypothetical protein [Actinomycetota bacterium]